MVMIARHGTKAEDSGEGGNGMRWRESWKLASVGRKGPMLGRKFLANTYYGEMKVGSYMSTTVLSDIILIISSSSLHS